MLFCYNTKCEFLEITLLYQGISFCYTMEHPRIYDKLLPGYNTESTFTLNYACYNSEYLNLLEVSLF